MGAVLVVEQGERRRFMETVVELQNRLEELGVTPQIALAAMASISKGLLSQLHSEPDRLSNQQEVSRG